MGQLGFQNINRAVATLEEAKKLVRGKVTTTKQAIVRMVLTDLVNNSPQWSGNLASQWFVEFHGHKGSYRPIPDYAEPWAWSPNMAGSVYSRGDNPAVGDTLARELPKIKGIRWNSTIRIVNYAPYADDVEQGVGPNGRPIRDENKLASYGGVAMVGYVTMKYTNLKYLKGVVV